MTSLGQFIVFVKLLLIVLVHVLILNSIKKIIVEKVPHE